MWREASLILYEKIWEKFLIQIFFWISELFEKCCPPPLSDQIQTFLIWEHTDGGRSPRTDIWKGLFRHIKCFWKIEKIKKNFQIWIPDIVGFLIRDILLKFSHFFIMKPPVLFLLFLLRGWGIAFFSFSVNHINKMLSLNLENGYISASVTKLKKLGNFVFSNLKSWRKESVSFFI